MDVAAYVYPWDVVGDPAASETTAGLGLDHAVVAAFYHATRALTPRHPDHRVVVAEHSASYLPVDSIRQGLLPRPQTWIDAEDAFGTTVSALAAAGVPSHAWVVVDHVDDFDGSHLVNAYGDVYRWALCPSHETTLEYATSLAAEIAARSDIVGVEFEAAGWYGFDHLHQHDKVAGISFSDDELYLMSLCFCDACRAEYQVSGIDASQLRTAVRHRLDLRFNGSSGNGSSGLGSGGLDNNRHLGLGLDAEPAAAVLAMRTRIADRLRGAIIREVRARRGADFSILFHTNPRPHRSTAFTGVDPATFAKDATGVVVNCWDGSTENVTLSTGHPAAVHAGLLGVRGMGAHPERLADQASAMREAGAAGIRLYHAGLASNSDLAAIRQAIAALRA